MCRSGSVGHVAQLASIQYVHAIDLFILFVFLSLLSLFSVLFSYLSLLRNSLIQVVFHISPPGLCAHQILFVIGTIFIITSITLSLLCVIFLVTIDPAVVAPGSTCALSMFGVLFSLPIIGMATRWWLRSDSVDLILHRSVRLENRNGRLPAELIVDLLIHDLGHYLRSTSPVGESRTVSTLA